MRSDAEERLALAADPATPAAMLKTLAQDATLAPIVAANPNITPDIFERLMVSHPIACGTNPALPLMALVDPTLLARFVKDRERALALLAAPQTSPFVLSAMNQHDDALVRETVRYHITMFSEADATAERRDEAIRHTCLLTDRYHTKTYFSDVLPSFVPAMWLNELLINHDCRTILARIRDMPPHIILALAEHIDHSRVAVLLARPDLPADVFTRLIERNDILIDAALVDDPRTTSQQLTQIATDEQCYIRISHLYAEGKYSAFFSHAVVGQGEATHLDREKVLTLNLVRSIQYRAAIHPNSGAEILDLLAQKRIVPVQLRRAIAANPHTRISTLQRLAHDDNKHVRQIVARHPHLTAGLVAVLLADHDLGVRHALAHNAHLTLSSLEQIVAQGDAYTRGLVAERASLSIALLARDRDSTVRHSVASAADVPQTLLRNLIMDSAPLVRQRAARHPSLPSEEIITCCTSADVAMRRAVANNPSLTTEQIVLLAADEDLRVRYHALRHPSLPATLLSDAAQHAAVEVRIRAAEHPELPGELVDLLAGDPEIAVRRAVFGHPHLSVYGLERFVAFDDEQSRRAVLRHPLINEAILLQLAHDPRDDIRMRVMKHPAATAAVQCIFAQGTPSERRALGHLPTAFPETLELLLDIASLKSDEDIAQNLGTPWHILERLQNNPTVLPLIAKHPNTPSTVLEQLAETRPDLYEEIAANPNASTESLDRIALAPQRHFLMRMIARHPNISQTLAATFVTHNEPTIRSAVASNLVVPEELLWPLAHDTELVVFSAYTYGNDPVCVTLAQRDNLSDALAHVLLEMPQTHIKLAKNQHCSADVYRYLALHGEWLVLKYLLYNPAVPLDLHIMLRAVFDEPSHSLLISNELENDIRQDILAMCARSSQVDLRLKAATHPLASHDLLLYLANDGQMRVRLSVAEHPNTPPAALARLARDAEPKVRAAAYEHRNTPLSALVARPYSGDEFNALSPLMPPPSFEIPSTINSPLIPMHQYVHWLHMCIRHMRDIIHDLLLSSTSTPPEALAEMAGSDSWLERYIIVRHPNTPPEIIQRLRNDTNRFVCMEARTRLG